jgi:hypothetical protein
VALSSFNSLWCLTTQINYVCQLRQ